MLRTQNVYVMLFVYLSHVNLIIFSNQKKLSEYGND